MPNRKGLLAPQNTFLDTIATRFDGTHSNFVLGNAKGKDFPIVYCSDGFCELTGYVRSMVMSKPCACTFLFGHDTAEDEKQKIDNALSQQAELKAELILYKKNGAPFWCLLDLVPIKNEKGQVVLFLVSHKDVTREKVSAIESSFGDTRQKLTCAVRSVTSAAQQLANLDANDEDAEKDTDNAADKPLLENEADEHAPALSGADHSINVDDDEIDEMRPNKEYLQKRRRSRAVLYHISGQFKTKSKSKLQLNHLQNLSGQKPLPEYKVQDLRTQKFIIPHYGIMRISWDWLILFCTFYIAVVVPFHAAFDIDVILEEGQNMSPVTDIIIEIMFMVDILLNFRTTFVNRSGQVVYDGRSIAFNYLKGWFILDLAAAIPFEILFALSVETGNIQVHLLKLCRMLRLARLLQKIDRYAQYSALVLALLMAMFALLAHWMACIWYVIGKTELSTAHANWTVGWLGELGNRMASPFSINKTGGPSIAARYVSALYFTCSSLTSVGFGNVSANTISEKIFSVCAMLLGSLMHAAVFGNVTAIIQRMYARRAAYQTKSNDLKDFMRIHHIPKSLKQRMQEFFQTMWSINHGIDHSEILAPFPEELRGDIALHLYRDMLSLPVFESASQGCRKKIAYQCRYRFCTPGECLIHTGDSVTNLYYISNGSMEVVRDGEVVAIMGKSDLFGTDFRNIGQLSVPANRSAKREQKIRQQLAMLRSQCDVRSLTYCDMQLLDIDKLVSILLQYPDFSQTFCATLRQEISYNLDEQNGSDCPSPTATSWPPLPPGRRSLKKTMNGYRCKSADNEALTSSSDDEDCGDNARDEDECFADSVQSSAASSLAQATRLRKHDHSHTSLPYISEVDEVSSSQSAERASAAGGINGRRESSHSKAAVDTDCIEATLVEQSDSAVLGVSGQIICCRTGPVSKPQDAVVTPTQSKAIRCIDNMAKCSSADDSLNSRQCDASAATVQTTDSQTKFTEPVSPLETSEPLSSRLEGSSQMWQFLRDNRERIHEVHSEVRSIQQELHRLGERFELVIEALNRRSLGSIERKTVPHCPERTDPANSQIEAASSDKKQQVPSKSSSSNCAETAIRLPPNAEFAEQRRTSYPCTSSSHSKSPSVTPATLRHPSSLLLFADDSTGSLTASTFLPKTAESSSTKSTLASLIDSNGHENCYSEAQLVNTSPDHCSVIANK